MVVFSTLSVIDPQEGKIIVRSLALQPTQSSTPLETEVPLASSENFPIIEDDEEKLASEISKDPENREGLLKLLTKAGNQL